jgi:hypothetical protein
MALSEEAKGLEALGKERDLGAIRQSVGGYRDRVAKLTESIRRGLSDDGQAPGGGRATEIPAASAMRNGFVKLHKAFSDGDLASVDALLGELFGMPLSDDLRGALSRVSAMASASECSEAAKIIEGILKQGRE